MKIFTFKADTHSVDIKTGEYRDPLMKWPLRGAAFTNEVGEALRPLIGNYATLSWVPALMYIGADIYDKYKNNDTEYSPNSKRLLKQAVFQGMASIFLPLVAVKAGQNLFSQFGRFEADKLSYNTKEAVGKVAETFIANGQMRANRHDDELCKQIFLDKVHNSIDFEKHKSSNSVLKKAFIKIEDKVLNFLKINNENLDKYATEVIEDLILHRKKMLTPSEEYKITKVYENFTQSLSKGQSKNVAVKTALTKFQQQKLMKGKIVRTIGGFIALGLLIKPIDKFVENVLIGKVVGPGIDNINFKKKDKIN